MMRAWAERPDVGQTFGLDITPFRQISALAVGGLCLDLQIETPSAARRRACLMPKDDDGFGRLPGGAPNAPAWLSIRAIRMQTKVSLPRSRRLA
jgi:hypothetical protein